MKEFNYRATYDREAQAGYIYLKENVDIGSVKKIGSDVYVNYDNNGNLIGIELLLAMDGKLTQVESECDMCGKEISTGAINNTIVFCSRNCMLKHDEIKRHEGVVNFDDFAAQKIREIE